MQNSPIVATKKPNIFRRTYDWVISWADSRYGVLALFLLALAEASFFPIPPDVLLIGLALGARVRALYFGTICTVGSITGAIIGYMIGSWIWWAEPGSFSGVALFFFDNVPGFDVEFFERIQVLYDKWNFWIVFTAGFTPIPYKIITISAGAVNINFIMFLIASIISRGARFYLVSGLIWKFGEPIREYIDKYFNLLAVIFTVLLIGGFIVIKYFSH